MKYHLTPVRRDIIKKSPQIANAVEAVRKGNSCTLLVDMQIGTITVENSMKVP